MVIRVRFSFRMIQNRRHLKTNDLLSILMKKHLVTVMSLLIFFTTRINTFPHVPSANLGLMPSNKVLPSGISGGTVQPWVHQGTHVLGRWTFYTIMGMNYTLVMAVIRGW